MSDQKQEGKQILSRREALKALAAATGAVTLVSLPGKWETPVVEVGALPAHAQGSGPRVFNLAANVFVVGLPIAPSAPGNGVPTSPTVPVEVTFDVDSPGGLLGMPDVFFKANGTTVPLPEILPDSPLTKKSGDEFASNWWGGFWVPCGYTVYATATDQNNLTSPPEMTMPNFGPRCNNGTGG